MKTWKKNLIKKNMKMMRKEWKIMMIMRKEMKMLRQIEGEKKDHEQDEKRKTKNKRMQKWNKNKSKRTKKKKILKGNLAKWSGRTHMAFHIFSQRIVVRYGFIHPLTHMVVFMRYVEIITLLKIHSFIF